MGPMGNLDADGSAVIGCEIPASEEEAVGWMERTLILSNSDERDWVGEKAMSSAEEMMREKKDGDDPICLCLHRAYLGGPKSEDTYDVTGTGFSFRVDHQMADGIGAYIIAGSFFNLLAAEIGGRSNPKVDWREATNNLPVPWVQMMNADQQTEGKDFEENVRRNTNLVLEAMVCTVHPLPEILCLTRRYRKASGV